MPLTLSVPAISARNSAEVELQPQKVKKWLEDLPLLNVAETSRKLFSTLSVHNRVEFDDKLRAELLELFRIPVIQTSRELSKQYIGLPLPLSDKHKTIAEQHRQFQMEMANGYKRIVLNSAGKPEIQPKDQACAIQRSIRYLTGALVVSYETYSPYPQGTWKEIHALYTHAEKLGLTQAEIDDPLNKTVTKSSIAHAYLQALLLDFSDPYHLPPRMIDKIHHYLDRWATLANLTDIAPIYNPTCQFLIDRESDRAGIAYAANTELKQSENYRLLNTVGLARQAHAQLTTLMSGKLPAPDGLYENFFKEHGEELLKRLISAWGVNPQRSFRRSEPTRHQIQMAAGLDAINYWINGGQKFVVSSTFVGPMPQRTQISAEVYKPANMPLTGNELSTWDVEDESAGGLSLTNSGQTGIRVHVGELIITRTPGEGNPWSVGVIRWAKSEGSSSVEIGVQYLAPSAEPMVIKTVNEDKKESDFLPALLLPEIKPLKRPPTLITHRGVYKPGTEIYMDNSYRLYKIIPTALIEASHSFEQFGFDILNT